VPDADRRAHHRRVAVAEYLTVAHAWLFAYKSVQSCLHANDLAQPDGADPVRQNQTKPPSNALQWISA